MATTSLVEQRRAVLPPGLSRHLPVLIGVGALLFITLYSLATTHWTTERGSFGPFLLASGGWLTWNILSRHPVAVAPGRTWLVALVLLPSLAMFIAGRAFDYIAIQVLGTFGIVLATLYAYFGAQLLRTIWFPILYFAFLMPIPGWVLDQVTAPLKTFASLGTADLLQLFGIEVVREGVILFVDQYQLLVEDACAGLNALFGLVALGLFYTYVAHGTSFRHCLVLGALTIPIAVAANILRIVILVLLTKYAGNDAAQGFLHNTAGLVMFMSALLLIFMADNMLALFWRKRAKAA